MATPTTTEVAFGKDEPHWDVWQNEQKVIDVIPALGESKNVFSSGAPEWFPANISSVLDAGCGVGIYRDFFVNQGINYTGIDGSKYMIDRAIERYPSSDFSVASLFDIPFGANKFDMVWANAVCIHIPTSLVPDAINEMRRVCKSNKYVCFNMYISEHDYMLQLDDDWGILNVWGEATEKFILENAFNKSIEKINIVEETDVMVGELQCVTRRYLIKK